MVAHTAQHTVDPTYKGAASSARLAGMAIPVLQGLGLHNERTASASAQPLTTPTVRSRPEPPCKFVDKHSCFAVLGMEPSDCAH